MGQRISGQEAFERSVRDKDNAQVALLLRDAMPDVIFRNPDASVKTVAEYLRGVTSSSDRRLRKVRKIYQYLINKRHLTPEFVASMLMNTRRRGKIKLPPR